MKIKLFLLFVIIATMWQAVQAQPTPQDSNDIVWQVSNGRIITRICFSNDSKQILTCTYGLNSHSNMVNFVEIRNVIDGGLITELEGESEFSLSRDGNILITKSSDTLILRQYPSLSIIKKITSDGFDGNFDILHDNQFFASAANVKGVRIFNINSGLIIKEINDFPFIWDPKNGGSPIAYRVRYNLDGTKLLFSGDWAFIYDLTLDTIIHTFPQSLSPTYSPDYSKIAIRQSNPAEVYIYNVETYLQEEKISLGDNKNFGFVFSPDGKYFVTASDNGDLNIWDIDSQKIVYNFYFDMFPKPALGHPAYSNDGKYIAFESGRLFLISPKITSVKDTISPILKVLYPNPTSGIVNIEFNLHKSEEVIFSISDNTGKLLNSNTIGLLNSGNNSYNFNSSALPVGIYYITLKSQSFSETYKLVKE